MFKTIQLEESTTIDKPADTNTNKIKDFVYKQEGKELAFEKGKFKIIAMYDGKLIGSFKGVF